METSPDSPPSSQPEPLENSSTNQREWFIKLALILYSGPLWGLVLTVISLIRTFSTLSSGNAAPEKLAKGIHNSLQWSMLGGIIGIIGVILILIAFFKFNIRELYFYRFGIFLSISWCLILFPYGLAVAIPVILIFLSNRSQFLNQGNHNQKESRLRLSSSYATKPRE